MDWTSIADNIEKKDFLATDVTSFTLKSDPTMSPYSYLTLIPSANQNVRRQFLFALNKTYFELNSPHLLSSIESIIAILHNLSLLIDDIEDSSAVRRGSPTAHVKFGVPLTINCANTMYFVAMQVAQTQLSDAYALENPLHSLENFRSATLRILISEMLNLHKGQGQDIYWRDFLDRTNLPLLEDYIDMVKHKTGGLFRLSFRLLSQCSAKVNNDAVVSVTNLLGIMYQIRDDYLNITDANYAHMKGVAGEDLVEGKLSFPVLHCLHALDDSPLHRYIFEVPRSNRLAMTELRQQCIMHMHETGLVEFTKRSITECRKKIYTMIKDSSGRNDEGALELLQIVERLCHV